MTVFLHPPPGLGHPSVCHSDANLLGLGGYYNVIKVRSKIRRGGQYDTDLECIFAASTTESCYSGDGCDATAAAASETIDDDPWGWLDDIIDALGGDSNPDIGVDGGETCQGKTDSSYDPWWSFF